ncbi:MAG: FHA domain-containing protein, partial [Myxococcota bacterium]|nr:FHA domain-containing protein [Myxococcota bacterium]
MFNLSIEDKHGGIADEYTFEEGEFLIGRSHSADIILPSDNVSRRHARLYTVDGGCFIEDLGSANGVFVNGRRIHEVVEIEGTAQVRVGDYYLHLKSDATSDKKDDVFCRLRGKNLSVADQIFPITRTVNLLGRGKDCTITVIDPSVSRIHAKL